jgi:redox-sensitive bicupin YhaK (pirin superfamily)
MDFHVDRVRSRAEGPLRTVLPIAHVRLQPRADAAFELEAGATTIVYAMSGPHNSDRKPSPPAKSPRAVSGARPSPWAGDRGFEAVALTALPIGELVISNSPFIMTTPEDIAQAFADYQSGRFAAVRAA